MSLSLLDFSQHPFLLFGFLLREVLLDEQKSLRLACLYCLLEFEHLVADIIANTNRSFPVLEFLPSGELQDP